MQEIKRESKSYEIAKSFHYFLLSHMGKRGIFTKSLGGIRMGVLDLRRSAILPSDAYNLGHLCPGNKIVSPNMILINKFVFFL